MPCKHCSCCDTKSYYVEDSCDNNDDSCNYDSYNNNTHNNNSEHSNLYFNNKFSKTFKHHPKTGELIDKCEYKKFCHGLECEDSSLLDSVMIHPESELKLADYYASFSCSGIDQKLYHLPAPGDIYSKSTAVEMVELYAKAISRDVSFCCYKKSSVIVKALESLNHPDVLKYLPDMPLQNCKITPYTIFRGNSVGETCGPYISQLLFLNVPMGAHIINQKYYVPPNKCKAIKCGLVTEWGRNNCEMVKIQNGKLSELPDAPTICQLEYKYIYNGRSLGELVHSDPVYQIYHNTGLILSAMGAKHNDGFMELDNCGRFINSNGIASLLCSVTECSRLALKYAWYWKWKGYKRVRPEGISLWIDNVLNNRKCNDTEYKISDIVLQSDIMECIKSYNAEWGCDFKCSYTLPQQYKEGSPTHPAYPAGHAVVAGALCTILKIYFDDTVKWKDLPIFSAEKNIVVPDDLNDVVIACHDGSKLRKYGGSDKSKLTVGHEINKLASNIALGRDWAGVHYRTDGTKGILLGELIAIDYMKSVMKTWAPKGRKIVITFTKFDGCRHTITVCN